MARSDVEVLSERCDDLGALTTCVGVVLDFEVSGIAHHPVADFFGKYWPERAVFVEGYFVACEDEDGGYGTGIGPCFIPMGGTRLRGCQRC